VLIEVNGSKACSDVIYKTTKKQKKTGGNCESFVLIEKIHSISDRCSHALPVLNTHTQISPLTILK